ncbi:MAG TPA: 2-oxo acid dehydrogenase subunit E2 [Methylomirabilota bacterium]|nr:2-oxo acid dehydrogenase subunit E2 [Methylomirabilota bacterium]
MDVKLPNLGEGADSGTVVNLLVNEGDEIKQDQPILELENEKAVASIPSTASGRVSKVHVKSGDKVSVGQKLISVEGDGGKDKSGDAKEEKEEKKPSAKARQSKEPEPDEDQEEDQEEQESETETETESGDEKSQSGPEPAASPSTRKIALQLGIDLRRVRGSESGGRIVMADLKAYIQGLQKRATQSKGGRDSTKAPPAESVDFSKWGGILKKPMSQLRQVISRRMSESWTTIPHVTQFDEADITAVLDLRKKFAADYDKQNARLTLTSFALKAVVAALKKHPIFNSSIDEAAGEIIIKEYHHIGLAVDTDAGLLVPVIRDVDKKSLLELSKDVVAVAEKARDRKLSSDDMKGGTFTISNQGGIGGAHFTPIVNKPEVAILGLGRGAWKAVVKDQQIVQRMMLPLGLSYDHRVIDGATAARFITDLVAALENFPENEVKLPA